MAKAIKCVACGNVNNVRFSLPLKRKKGEWCSTPICAKCRRLLISEAKAEGKFIPIYGLASSNKEADKRNGQVAVCKPLLEAFALAERKKKRPKKVVPFKKTGS